MKTTQVLSPESVRGGLKKMGLLALMLVAAGAMLGFGMDTGDVVMLEAPAAIADTVTTTAAKEVSPYLLMTDVEKRVTEFLPSRFPLDTLIRNIGRNEQAESLEVGWYATDYIPFKDKVKTAVTSATGLVDITVDNIDFFSLHQTVVVDSKSIQGTDKDYLSLLVISVKRTTSQISVVAINGTVSGTKTVVPNIPADTPLILCGRAKSEKDRQTTPSATLPTRETNLQQMFMVQVEESEYQKLSKKEVEWGFQNYKNQNMTRLRAEMELSYIFGAKSKTVDPEANNTKQTCNGIIRYGIKRWDSPTNGWDNGSLIDFSKSIFVGNNGSDERFFTAGSDLIAAISKAPLIQKQQEAGKTKVKHGVTWNEIETNFGILYLKYAPMYDEIGKPSLGLVIDPANIGKKTMVPMSIEELKLKESGQSNVDAAIIRETSCPVVYNPDTHMAINL